MRRRHLALLTAATLAAPAALHAQAALAPVPIAPMPAVAPAAEPVPEAGSKLSDEDAVAPGARHFGLSYGAGPGIVAIDLEVGHFYGFASTSLPLDVFAHHDFAAGALGLGMTFKLRDPRWSFDVWAFGIPAHNTVFGSSPNTVLAFGLGGGFHFTGAEGFMVGLKFPILGTAVSLNDHGFDEPAERAAMFYLCSLLTLPVATIGYRF